MMLESPTELTNSRIKRLLLDKENIEPLEEILSVEEQRLTELEELKVKGMLDFGQKFEVEELDELVSGIKTEVDQFLGVEDIGNVNYGYRSFKNTLKVLPGEINYNRRVPLVLLFGTTTGFVAGALMAGDNILPALQFIPTIVGGTVAMGIYGSQKAPAYHPGSSYFSLKRTPKANLVETIGHEYAHHVQHQSSIPMDRKHSAFFEGHSHGVGRKIGNNFREREDNNAFMYVNTHFAVGHLKDTYKWMCKRLGQEPDKNLLDASPLASGVSLLSRQLQPRALGNTFFYILEATQGNQVYKMSLSPAH